MSHILDHFKDHEVRHFNAMDVLMAEGARSGHLFVLIEGAIEVMKGDIRVDYVTEPGAVFGEIAALLDMGHTADVRAAKDSSLYVIEAPRAFLIEHPEAHLHVSELLARRVNNLVRYLADVKQQYEGHDHIGMVDQVLDTLILRQPRRRAVKELTEEDP